MDMYTLFRQGINEYTRQMDAKKTVDAQTDRMASLMKCLNFLEPKNLPFHLGNQQKRMLLLIAPLVEVAWADGRVTRREMDAILRIADVYGLLDHEPAFFELMRSLTSRPMPEEVQKNWLRFHMLCALLTFEEIQTVKHCLIKQAEFVAEQSSNDMISFMRGERICEKEQESVEKIKVELRQAKVAAEIIEKGRTQRLNKTASGKPQNVLPQNYVSFEEVVLEAAPSKFGKPVSTMIPPENVWTETNALQRERQVIFEAA
jgi:hypothetical protein